MGLTDSLVDPLNIAVPAAVVPTPVDESLAGTHGASKIMLVDDEPINIGVTRKYLKMAGYTNFAVTTEPTQAMELIRRERPDILLLDIVMPRVSGLDILTQLRADPELMRLPVIILTIMSDLDTKHHALLSGSNRFPQQAGRLHGAHRTGAERVDSQSLSRPLGQLCAGIEAPDSRADGGTGDVPAGSDSVPGPGRRMPHRRDQAARRSRQRLRRTDRRGLGMDDQAVESIDARLLHDVGKIGFSDSVLEHASRFAQDEADLLQKHGVRRRQPRPHVLQEESATYRSHTIAGSRIMAVGKSRILELAATIAMTHHEKWDGTGYPFGIAGSNIPVESRIVAVANAFDHLSTSQYHRPAFSDNECFAVIADGGGTHFDPTVVEAFALKRPEILQLSTEILRHPRGRSARGRDVEIPGASPCTWANCH